MITTLKQFRLILENRRRDRKKPLNEWGQIIQKVSDDSDAKHISAFSNDVNHHIKIVINNDMWSDLGMRAYKMLDEEDFTTWGESDLEYFVEMVLSFLQARKNVYIKDAIEEYTKTGMEEIKDEIEHLESQLKQIHIDMEEEAEPEGGPIVDEYATKLEEKEKEIAAEKAKLNPEILGKEAEQYYTEVYNNIKNYLTSL